MLLLLLESSMRSSPLTTMIAITASNNDHAYILAIKNKCAELNSAFTFKSIDKEQIFITIKQLGSKKASKSNDKPLKLTRNFVAFSEASSQRFFPR